MRLIDGRVYRTQELRRWSANPTRLAEQLVETGALTRLRHGLYYRPERSKWGPVPPRREELLRAALGDTPFLISGSSAWNPLGLGATAVFAAPLIYNTKYTGEREIAGQRFHLRRVRFPRRPSPEWFVIDLIQHRAMAGVDLATIERALRAAIAAGRYDPRRLTAMADQFGTREVQAVIARCGGGAGQGVAAK